MRGEESADGLKKSWPHPREGMRMTWEASSAVRPLPRPMALRMQLPEYRPVDVFRVKGSSRDVGEQLGARFAKEARRAVAIFKTELTWEKGATLEGAKRYGRKILPLVDRWYPDFVEEMRGYAKGSGVKFDVLVAQWSGYSPSVGLKGCTDLAVGSEHTADGSVLVAHNEDYTPEYEGNVVPVHVTVDDKPSFFAMSYQGLFPTMGFNDAGVSMTGNALSPNDIRTGIPKMIPARRILDATNLMEALAWSMPEGRGSSFNNIVCSRDGELYSMEGSATAFDALYCEDGWLVHTNHYLSPKMWKFERNPHTKFCSILRYNRARRLLKPKLGRVTPETLMDIQRDHLGNPDAICRHVNPRDAPEDRTKTLFGSIVNLTTGEAYVSGSPPCETEYRVYRLGS